MSVDLKIDDVTRTYDGEAGRVEVLRGISFGMQAGELAGDHRPVGFGQEHAVAHRRHAR